MCIRDSPTYIVDDGQRLGKRFYSFRQQVCTSKFNGFANEWIDKPDAEEAVANVLKDIVIRYALNDCIDLPETSIRTMYTNSSNKTRKAYNTLSEESVLYTKQGTINAVNAGARVKKLLQSAAVLEFWETHDNLDVFKFSSIDTLIMGSESSGVPETIHQKIPNKVRVPIGPSTRSLNVAVCASMVLWEALRQTENLPSQTSNN
mgnify:CR=1 FL=1